MAKGVILEDKITGGQILPVTSSDLVFDPVNNKTQKELNDEFSKEKANAICFYNAGFGKTMPAAGMNGLMSIKSIQLIGDWPVDKQYVVRHLCRNHTTSKYRFSIYSVDSDGNFDSEIAYNPTPIDVIEAGAGKITKVVFPTHSGRYVVALIDYNSLPDNSLLEFYNANNYLIKPESINPYQIDLILENTNNLNLISDVAFKLPFFDSGFDKMMNESDINGIKAIKSIQLIGDWDKGKTYAIRSFSRNHTTFKYRFRVSEVDETGSQSAIYDSGNNVEVAEAGVGKITTVKFPIVRDRCVIASIDYNSLVNGFDVTYEGRGNNYIIKSENVVRTELFENKPLYDAAFGKTMALTEISSMLAIKDIRLIGDFDITKNYGIRYFANNHPSDGYRIIIREVDSDGNSLGDVYNVPGSFTLTPEVDGLTKVIFPKINERQVIAWINYRISEVPSLSHFPNGNNYVINPSQITASNSQDDYILQNNMVTISDKFDITDYGRATINGIVPEITKQIGGGQLKPLHHIISDKRGAIMYRIDDNHSPSKLMAFSGVLDKYGHKFTNCINIGMVSQSATGFIDAVKVLQSKGHEIADHTPNHNTKWADMPTQEMASLFIGMAGVAQVKDNRVVFEVEYPADHTIYEVAGVTIDLIGGTKTVEMDTSNLTEGLNTNNILYIPGYGWAGIINPTSTQVTIDWNQHWASEEFSANKTVPLYCTSRNNAHVTTNGCRAMLLCSLLMFKYYGLERPYVFVHPGTSSSPALPQNLKEAGQQLGYIGASTMVGGNKPKIYNDSDELARWGDWWGVHWRIEDDSLDTILDKITDLCAKHEISSDAGHFWDANYIANSDITGDSSDERWQDYLSHIDAVSLFAVKNDIPVLTYQTKNEALYLQSQNPATNMVPPLFKDIRNAGKPDGYTLGTGAVWSNTDGVEEDKRYSLKISGNGNLFKISRISGFEHGVNNVIVYATGDDDVNINISLKSNDEVTTYDATTITLNGASTEMSKFTKTLNIPFDVKLFTLVFDVSNNTNELIVSGIKILKSN